LLHPVRLAEFNPALPVSSQTTLYAGVNSAACGDGFTLPPGYRGLPHPALIVAVEPEFPHALRHQLEFGIQRSLTSLISLDVEYVGNHATKLLGQFDANQPNW